MLKKALFLYIFLFALFFSGTVFAQSENANSGNVMLNIKLYPIQTITINESQREVTLSYETKQDYESGVSSEMNNHLTIFSTGGFEVKANAPKGDLEGTKKTIEASDILITASKGSNNNLNAQYSAERLSINESTIIQSTTGGINQEFNINYQAEGNDKYINHFSKDENPTIFSTRIVYSITSK